METNRTLTPFSSTLSQRPSSVLPKSHSRFVLCAGVSETEVTFDHSAHEGTKRMRSDAIEPVGSVTAHLASGGQGRRRNCLRRDRDLGENYAANVRSNAKDR